MIDIELHAVQSPEDVEMAAEAGLLDTPSGHGEDECAECGDFIGEVSGEFVPYAIVLATDDEWLLCNDCSKPAVRPSNRA